MVNKKISIKESAYTLIELSIVISIIAVLMTGAIGISVSLINISKKNSTVSKIDTLYNAIGKFVMINKRLPCPASINLPSNHPQFGIERISNSGGCLTISNEIFTNNANIYFGMIPVRSLGLSLDMAQDEFGGKLSYVIDQRFAWQFLDIPDFTKSSFGTVDNPINSGIRNFDSLPAITVSERILSATPRVITNDAVLVIMSHGKNKYGAYNYNSSSPNPSSQDADEATNYQKSPVSSSLFFSSVNSQAFDDIVFFKTRNQIVDDFDLHNIVACNFEAPFTSPIYYGLTVYLPKCLTTYKRVPEAYCDRFGRMVIMNKCP